MVEYLSGGGPQSKSVQCEEVLSSLTSPVVVPIQSRIYIKSSISNSHLLYRAVSILNQASVIADYHSADTSSKSSITVTIPWSCVSILHSYCPKSSAISRLWRDDHVFMECLSRKEPDISSCKSSLETLPFVKPSLCISRVSSHAIEERTLWSSNSRNHCTCEINDLSAGALTCCAVMAAKTDIASTHKIVWQQYGPYSRSRRACSIVIVPVSTS